MVHYWDVDFVCFGQWVYFGRCAYQGGFSEGRWECTLQDTELYLRFFVAQCEVEWEC